MNLIPDEELKTKSFFNLTPMVDFLFLIVALFATLALTRTELFDAEIQLAKVKESDAYAAPAENVHIVNLCIEKNGNYKWVTEFNEYTMEGIPAILQELSKQEQLGILPSDKTQTKILLHIDQQTQWDPVAQLVYSLKKTGYFAYPVYEFASSTR